MKHIILYSLAFFIFSCATSNRQPQQAEPVQPPPLEKLTSSELESIYKPADQLHPLCQHLKQISKIKPIKQLNQNQSIDLVLVSKSDKKTYLFSGDQLIYKFHSSFGPGFKKGNKIQSGDKRTPEGIYQIADKNPNSKYHLALKISYPNEADIAFAKKYNTPVGSDIMFHGLPNGFDEDEDMVSALINSFNWTAGCVAMNNRNIEIMYDAVQVGTTVAICPRE